MFRIPFHLMTIDGEQCPVWVFDVDGCLIDSLTGTSLRPGATALLAGLRASGRTVIVWSAGGGPYARHRAEQHDVAHLVDAFHGKDSRDSNGAYEVHHLVEESTVLVFVDDRPEDMPSGHEVIAVPPYLASNPHDRALQKVAERAGITWPDTLDQP